MVHYNKYYYCCSQNYIYFNGYRTEHQRGLLVCIGAAGGQYMLFKRHCFVAQ